ncbi:MAG: Fic family protein [Sphingobacteriales bacterium]|nr:Fic family protein [Sphingobacteriales bacterium]OJY90421.1 MAG: cell filamentation protein Fic [Sphingobacteriales bacterium 44-15]
MLTEYQRKIARELEVIKTVLQQFPEGASAGDIIGSGLDIELRTLQRRLETLIEEQQVRRTGARRLARYHLGDTQNILYDEEVPYVANQGTSIPLSNQSKEILAILSKPFNRRAPVGYNRVFADQYRPNKDFYLSKAERDQLANLTATTGAAQQPAGTYIRHILQRLLIDLSWNSSRLEGNTYSLLDTERLLSRGEAAAGKSTAEAQMILNHKEAIEFMVSDANEIDFNRYSIQNLHALLSNNLLPDPAAPGRLRSYTVGIKKSVYTPTAIPHLIEEMFVQILDKTAAIKNPHEQALFIMVQLPYLQPFEDVNKRVSRLAANIPLNKRNLVPISFIGVPDDLYVQGLLGVYELNRIDLLKDVFLWACRQSADRYAQVRQTIGEPDPFRMKYRDQMQKLVSEIVVQGFSSTEAASLIQAQASVVSPTDASRFVELVETELLSLHEGNFARYRVSPSEFKRWKRAWSK